MSKLKDLMEIEIVKAIALWLKMLHSQSQSQVFLYTSQFVYSMCCKVPRADQT